MRRVFLISLFVLAPFLSAPGETPSQAPPPLPDVSLTPPPEAVPSPAAPAPAEESSPAKAPPVVTPEGIAVPEPATPEPAVVDVPSVPPTEAAAPEMPPAPAQKPTKSHAVTPGEFRELSLSLRPGSQNLQKNPAGWSDPAFSFATEVTYFLHSRVGANAFYAYTRFGSAATTHAAGGGPLFRYLESEHFRGAVEANMSYVRALDGNHLGWNVGGDITFGFRRSRLRPFFGPFFRYDYIFVPGPNVRAYTIGGGLTLTELADVE